MPVIHWFRRDLRITDNTALNAALQASDEVIPVYLLSDWKGKHGWTGAPRQEFLCGCLESLAGNVESAGGRLIIRSEPADVALGKLLRETGATALYFNRDPDPFGREMERKIADVAAEVGRGFHGFHDVTMHEPDAVLTGKGEPFRVFTPYSKAWMRLEGMSPGPKVKRFVTPVPVASEPLPTLARWGLQPEARVLEPGEKAARRRLSGFLEDRIFRYGQDRNIPAGKTTSQLSADLRFGTLSIREVFARCFEAEREGSPTGRRGVATFINELVWREFYMQLLWHYPGVLREDFSPNYRHVIWRGRGGDLERWKAGMTGFPIVDAGMRQLLATGYLHNRLRMIVAMFLTKDLHIHWKHGEQWFMQRLVDGEIASNNGGWQWSAGTGADAAPYFRIQNPWTQSKRFDPDGTYIREWLPELRDVPVARLHQPPPEGESVAGHYPAPMVDHAEERLVTLDRFKGGTERGKAAAALR